MPWLTYGQILQMGGTCGDGSGTNDIHYSSDRSFYDANIHDQFTVPYYRPIGIAPAPFNGFNSVARQVVANTNCVFEGHPSFLAWLIATFGPVSLCTDLDLHLAGAEDTGLLDDYRLLICSGHDEYWTGQMRVALANHVRSGRNVAHLSGDNLYWFVEITSTQSSSPQSTLYSITDDKRTWQWQNGNWNMDSPEWNATGMSGRGNTTATTGPGGYILPPSGSYVVPPQTTPAMGTQSVSNSWITRNVTATTSPTSNVATVPTENAKGPIVALIGYEFDTTVYPGTSPDFVVVATTISTVAGHNTFGGYTGAYQACDTDPGSTAAPVSASMGYFQPYGGIVNVGTTEWIKCATEDPAVVGQITNNIVRTLSGDRTFIGVGRFSRALGFGIGYSTQVELSGDPNTSCVLGFWALDCTETSATVERGKWLSWRQLAPGYALKAFGRNANGASRVYYQSGAGDVVVWDIQMTTTDSRTLLPNVNIGADCFTTSWSLIGAALISGVSDLDLVFVKSNQIAVQMMNGWGSTLGNAAGTAVIFNMPTSASVAAFGFVPTSSGPAAAVAFIINGTQILISQVTMSGLVNVVETSIMGVASTTQFAGLADLDGDGIPELLISNDAFGVAVTAGIQAGVPLSVAADAVWPLPMKSDPTDPSKNYLHDPQPDEGSPDGGYGALSQPSQCSS